MSKLASYSLRCQYLPLHRIGPVWELTLYLIKVNDYTNAPRLQFHQRAPSQPDGWLVCISAFLKVWTIITVPFSNPSTRWPSTRRSSRSMIRPPCPESECIINHLVELPIRDSQWKNKESPGWASFTNHRNALRMFRFVGIYFRLYGSSVSTMMSSFA
jgi:hypothetical protein